ncbi:MAG: hypothetical protein GY801_13835 [bacterium]|nr:hypothetical protein [bacterium]
MLSNTDNPYVGPRAFEEEDSRNFFGRKAETRQLASLAIAHRVVVLYAPSGAGKTSLLKAGLIPYLKKRKRIKILPICRVGGDLPPDVDGKQVKNIYILNTLVDLASEAAQTVELLNQSLTEGLSSYVMLQNEPKRALPSLLIIDQFEELFTTHSGRYPERADFFLQLQHSLQRYPNLSLLLAMREDYIAQLDSYAAQLPDRLRTRFRLELLGEETARQAVREPAQTADIEFTDAAVQQLVDDLRKVQVQQADDTTKEQFGRHVEPVQLQVVCRRLWEQLPDDATQIGTTDLETVGNVDTALADYYADRTTKTAEQTKVRERTIREWFDRQLITEQGIRGQVLRGQEQSQGLDNLAIAPLVDAHLVRAEKRLNATWYELAHDRLIEPVRSSNAEWFQKHLSPLQRQADLWENQNRSSGLLLRDDALNKAERWAAENQDELTYTEHDFLAACREARAIVEKAQRQARRIRWLAIVSTIIGVIAIIAAVFAMIQRQSAQENAEIAKIRAAEAENARNFAQETEKNRTRSLFESYLTHASLKARIEDYAGAQNLLDKSRELDQDMPAERRHARNLMHWFTNLMSGAATQTYTGADVPLWDVALSPDGRVLAAVGERGMITLFDPDTAALLKRWSGHANTTKVAVFHPHNLWLATAGTDQRIVFWSLPEGEKLWEWNASGDVLTLAFSPDGTRLASGGADNNVTLWDVATGRIVQTLEGHSDAVQGLAFSPDGRLLASASSDQTAKIWDITTSECLHDLHGHTKQLNSLMFHPNGHILATGSDDQTIRLWDVGTGKLLRGFTGHKNEVLGIVFVDDGRYLVSASRDRTLRIWQTESGVTLRVLQGHDAVVNNVIANAEQLFSASGDHTVKRWAIQSGDVQQRVQILDLPDKPVAAAIAPDGLRLALIFADGTLRLYTLPDCHLVWERSTPVAPIPLYHVVFSPDSTLLATINFTPQLNLWQVRDGSLQQTFDAPSNVLNVSFSRDGTMLATAGFEGLIGLLPINEPEGQYQAAHEGQVYGIDFAPEGQRLLSGGSDGKTLLWDWRVWPMTLIQSFDAQQRVYWTVFSPDGRHIASVGREQLVRVLNADGELEQTFAGHEKIIYRVMFSPDSGQVITASTDTTIRVWDLTARQELFTLRLPVAQSDAPLSGFDFRCSSGAASSGNCWIAVPLPRNQLLLYDLGQPYK